MGGKNGEIVQTETMVKMNALNQAMSDNLLNKLPARITIQDFTPHDNAGKSYDLKSEILIIDKSNIASVDFTSVARSQGYVITFKTPVSVTYAAPGEAAHIVQLKAASVQLGDITDGTKPVVPVGDKLVQAGYNYFVIANDGSYGIHNPGFVADVLNTSFQALK